MDISDSRKVYLKRIKKEKNFILLFRFLILVLFLLGWEVLARLEFINTFTFSSPSRVITTLISLFNEGILFKHIGVSLYEILICFIISCGIGLLVSSILWSNFVLSKIVEPYLTVLNSLPKVALGPLIIIWVGAGIQSIEKEQNEKTDDVIGIAIYRDTKYPINLETLKSIVKNYSKTSSSTFEPKQSDKRYFFCPSSGTVVVADSNAIYEELNAKLMNGTDGQGNALSFMTEWIDLTEGEEILYTVVNAKHETSYQTTYYFSFPEAQYHYNTQMLTFMTEDGPKVLKQMILLRTSDPRIEEYGEELTINGVPEDRKNYYTPSNSTVSPALTSRSMM